MDKTHDGPRPTLTGGSRGPSKTLPRRRSLGGVVAIDQRAWVAVPVTTVPPVAVGFSKYENPKLGFANWPIYWL